MKTTIKRLVCALFALVIIACFVHTKSVSAAPAFDRLNTTNQDFYQFLKTEITAVANGTKTSTVFVLSDPDGLLKWTKEDLGVSTIIANGAVTAEASNAFQEKFKQVLNLERILNSLLADCPYELFWYNKIKGTSIATKQRITSSEMAVTDIIFKLSVSEDYSSGEFTTNPTKIAMATAANNNAKAIVAKHASKSDWDKLKAYKDEICQLVSYNHAAADSSSTPYGNPWQLISVFDNNTSTNVVCEGYSKAFKYLCDLSEFDGNVECYLVDGHMQGGTGAGPHMWNVVEIDGGTLLVDVTNCDDGTIGAPDKLFLQVGQKIGNRYSFDCGTQTIYYSYSETEQDLHTDGYLELKPVTQQPPMEECSHSWSATLTSNDPEGHYYACDLCTEKNSFAEHTFEEVITKATLTADGSVVQKCDVCGHVASAKDIARPTTFTLSTVNYTYNGQAKKPAVTVKDSSGKTLVNGTDYTVTYPSGRTALGSYNVTITMKGNYSGTKTLTFKIGLATPTVTVSNAPTGVKITWNKIAGATSYKVYKSVYSGGKWSGWVAIKTGVTGTTYTDTSVKSADNVKYTVRAFNGSHSSAFKASNSIKYLAAPTVTVSNAANGVKISWNKIAGTKTYTVYKSVYSGGKWSGWKAIKTGLTTTTYTDTSVKSNDNVRYTVRVFNGNFSSNFKASSSIKFLATPTVKATNAAKGVTVTWNKIAGAKTYTVYRSVYSGGKWSGWVAIKTGVTGTSFTDTTVKSGATVRYTVKAINSKFNSNVKASNTTKFLAQPAVKVAKATNGIKASWAKSAGATGYIVYRRTYSGGKWSGWTQIKITTAASYTDTTAKKGVTYQYTARAYSGSYKSSFTSSASIKR